MADALRLGVIGDVHARFDRLDVVLQHLHAGPPLDAVLLVGDVSHDPPWAERATSHDAQRASFAGVLHHIEAALGLAPFFVPGNHDPRDIPCPGNLDGRLQTLDFVRIFGIGGAGPGRFGFPYEWDEPEIAAIDVPPCDVLLCHCPPHDTPLDALHRRRGHVGSTAIRAHALAHRGVLLCGHIHESAGFHLLGDCLCVNVGALGEPFGRACVGRLEIHREADGGLRYEAELTELPSGATRQATHRVLPC